MFVNKINVDIKAVKPFHAKSDHCSKMSAAKEVVLDLQITQWDKYLGLRLVSI